MGIYYIPPLVGGIFSVCLGTFVYVKNRKSILNKTLAGVWFSLSVWLFSYTVCYLIKNEQVAAFFARIACTAVLFLAPTSYHFVVSLLGKKQETKFVYMAYFISFIMFLGFLWTNFLLSGVYKYFWGYYSKAGILHPLFLLFFIGVIARNFQLLYMALKSGSGLPVIKRNQIKYVLLAFIMPIGGSIDFIPKYGIEIYPFGFIFVIMMASIIAYAILKYRLMDIRVVITRTGIFIAVYAAVLGIPFAAATWYQGVFTKLLGVNWWILPLGAMALLATASPFVYIFLVRKAEDILFRDQRHYQNTLRELSKTLIRIRSLDQLSRSIVLTIANTVKTSFAAIYLKEEETKSYRLKQSFPETAHSGLDEFISYDCEFVKALERHKRPFTSEEIASEKSNSEVGLIVPCFMEDDLLGFMVLGVKTHNQVFTPDDILIFETFSYSASLAIENCIFWKEIEDRHRKARLQEMDTFSYSLAHEIDNPMTFVYNLARFLKSHFVKYITESKEREEVEEMCDIIKEGSQRVMSMVKAIRQFGQKTSGELEPLNLQETIEGFFKLYSPELKANFVLFSKDLPPEPIYVKGVAAELQQVLIILAKNALHAMQSSPIKQLTLKLSKVNHNTARVEVIDTGYGIRKESLHTIFEPFFTTKASSEGTGMGLHNAKGFIIRHKGRIWAESDGKDRGLA